MSAERIYKLIEGQGDQGGSKGKTESQRCGVAGPMPAANDQDDADECDSDEEPKVPTTLEALARFSTLQSQIRMRIQRSRSRRGLGCCCRTGGECGEARWKDARWRLT